MHQSINNEVTMTHIILFFFSSRRRNTRWTGDWSSDVCSSDLERIALGVRTRLAVLEPHREAVRRMLAYLTLPANLPLGPRLLYRTVDMLWHAAGDRATDFSFYTKRGLLAGIYATTTLYWLDDKSPNHQATAEFLDRRIAEVMQIPKLRGRVTAAFGRLPNPLRAFGILARLRRA